MIAVAFLIANHDDRVKAEKLGFDMPPPEMVEREVMFPLCTVSFVFKVDSEKIKIITNGQEVLLKYTDETYSRIKAYLEHI